MRAVVAMDRAGDGDRALRIEQPVALVVRDVQVVGDDLELLAGHVEHRAGIDRHPVSFLDVGLPADVGRE